MYYRQNVFPIEVPPLRSRKDDIHPLAEYFLDQAARRLNRPPLKMTLANLNRLQSHDWPGNVRELQNVIERAVILSRTGRLTIDLPFDRDTMPGTVEIEELSYYEKQSTVLTEQQLKDLQRANMLAALKQCGWKIYGRDGAAQLLQIKPTTLVERMKRCGVTRPDRSRRPSDR